MIREVPATDALGPQGEYVASLISNISGVTSDEAERLAASWAATRDAARDTTQDTTMAVARAAARDAAWDATLDATWDATLDATWGATRGATWDAALDATLAATWALLARGLITTEQYDALTRPWRTAIGPIHPDDPAL